MIVLSVTKNISISSAILICYERGYDERCDWFSFGQTILECATGKLQLKLASGDDLPAVRYCRAGVCDIILQKCRDIKYFDALVQCLTQVHPYCRCGSKVGYVQSSKFMSGSDWTHLLKAPVNLLLLKEDEDPAEFCFNCDEEPVSKK